MRTATYPGQKPSLPNPSPMLIGGVLVVLLLSMGCDETVNPIVGDERPFTLWGFMDAGADTQRVRVFSIEERLGINRDGPIDAIVTSIDLDTGEQRQWRDKEITFEDGTVGHVFWSPFRAVFEHRYRLVVTRSDGATSSVDVTIPPSVELNITATSLRTRYRTEIIGFPPKLHQVEVEYDVLTVPPANPWPPGTPTTQAHRFPVAISYDEEIEPTGDGWLFDIDLREDFPRIQDAFEENCLTKDRIVLRQMTVRFLAANEAWSPPGGTFDPEVLIEPGAFSNVENGLGFYGGGFAVSTRLVPPIDVSREVGFIFVSPCARGPEDIPICQLPPEPCFKDADGNNAAVVGTLAGPR